MTGTDEAPRRGARGPAAPAGRWRIVVDFAAPGVPEAVLADVAAEVGRAARGRVGVLGVDLVAAPDGPGERRVEVYRA